MKPAPPPYHGHASPPMVLMMVPAGAAPPPGAILHAQPAQHVVATSSSSPQPSSSHGSPSHGGSMGNSIGAGPPTVLPPGAGFVNASFGSSPSAYAPPPPPYGMPSASSLGGSMGGAPANMFGQTPPFCLVPATASPYAAAHHLGTSPAAYYVTGAPPGTQFIHTPNGYVAAAQFPAQQYMTYPGGQQIPVVPTGLPSAVGAMGSSATLSERDRPTTADSSAFHSEAGGVSNGSLGGSMTASGALSSGTASIQPKKVCEHGSACTIQAAAHVKAYLHPIGWRPRCPYLGRCGRTSSASHTAMYSHDPQRCPNDGQCQDNSPLHRLQLLHTQGHVKPRCADVDCSNSDPRHVTVFDHSTPLCGRKATCDDREETHRRRFCHHEDCDSCLPRLPYCTNLQQRGSCSDRSEPHLALCDHARYPCQHGIKCRDSSEGHVEQFLHPAGWLPRCPDAPHCSNHDEGHRTRYHHVLSHQPGGGGTASPAAAAGPGASSASGAWGPVASSASGGADRAAVEGPGRDGPSGSGPLGILFSFMSNGWKPGLS